MNVEYYFVFGQCEGRSFGFWHDVVQASQMQIVSPILAAPLSTTPFAQCNSKSDGLVFGVKTRARVTISTVCSKHPKMQIVSPISAAPLSTTSRLLFVKCNESN